MSKINIAQYIYWENETDNIVLLNARTRGNSKTTGDDNVPMLETVNFSLEAVINNDFKLDGGSCGDCPRSYNQNDGKSGKCYCHAGHERFALIRMLKQCHKLWNARKIKPFSLDAFDEWWSAATYSNIYRFLRFGRYGDPYFVGEQVNTLLYERALAAAGGNIVTTGYTHQWRREDATYLQRMMMASIDSLADYAEADRAGWRKYVAIKKSEVDSIKDFVGILRQCPASKQARERQGEQKVTCSTCAGCGGDEAKVSHDFYILEH